MSRITRKELKSDKFALEVEHTVTFFEEHRNDIIRYGAIALAVLVLILGYTMYSRSQHSKRQQALAKAIQIQETAVGQSGTTGLFFATQEAKDAATLKAFSEVASQYSGSEEAQVATYYLGDIKADQGKLAEAERHFLDVAQKGNDDYSSLAKLALAQIYTFDGRTDQAEKTLRELIADPTVFVSKDQATITLARLLLTRKPAEARKLLDPLRTKAGSVGQVAVKLYGDLPPQ